MKNVEEFKSRRLGVSGSGPVVLSGPRGLLDCAHYLKDSGARTPCQGLESCGGIQLNCHDKDSTFFPHIHIKLYRRFLKINSATRILEDSSLNIF